MTGRGTKHKQPHVRHAAGMGERLLAGEPSLYCCFRYCCFVLAKRLLGLSRGEAAMRAILAFVILLVLGVAAYAAETITYTYDARGRLVRVSHSGSVNNNAVTNYTIDKAENRTNKTTTGAP